MKEFYRATSEVVNLEHLFLGSGKKQPDGFHMGFVDGVDYLEIYLKPVGTTDLPRSPVQLKAALLCILRCIKQLHSLGYYHTDIRWLNVVQHENAWIFIDCYDFCGQTDNARLVAIKRQRTAGVAEDAEWCATDDLLQVMALARAREFCGDEYRVFDAVHEFVDQVVADTASVDDVIELINHFTV